MTCDECESARETDGAWRRFDSRKCTYCAARLIRSIRKLPIDRALKTARSTAALADSVAAGLDEKEIRKLVAAVELPMCPTPKGKKK